MLVVTNGCLDVIHVGHVRLFQKCRELAGNEGTVIVALNTDESIRRLKGPTRPINTLEHRREVLQAIRYIDDVIPFNTEEELADLYRRLVPDILVKGPPWKADELTGREYVGRVVMFDALAHTSSSQIINGSH